ncbi:hypothetical protein FG379_001829 [Cryptosporidium bovis]|uniref:uncharacterized protein n=1 Tax=Cryptosporidium bovis TaxID=310047 RepID=UPI00351A3492|nr:hypothetical protein FG379_001829 [Cryptosporidium bovis]
MTLIGNEIRSIDRNLQELDKTVKNLEDELLRKQNSLSRNKIISRAQSSGGCGIGLLISKSPKKNSNIHTGSPNNSVNIGNTVLVKSGFSSPTMNAGRDLIGVVSNNIEMEKTGNISLAKNNSIVNNVLIENEVQFAANPNTSSCDNVLSMNNPITANNSIDQQNCIPVNQLDVNNCQIPTYIQYRTHNTTSIPPVVSNIPIHQNINHSIGPSCSDYNPQMIVQIPNQIHLQQTGSGIIESINQQQLPPPLKAQQLGFNPHQSLEIQTGPLIPQQIMVMPQVSNLVAHNHIQGGQILQFPGMIQPPIPTVASPPLAPMMQGYNQFIPNSSIGMMDFQQQLCTNNNIPVPAISSPPITQNPSNISQIDQNNVLRNNNPLGMDSQMLAKYLLTAMAEECLLKKNSCVEKGTEGIDNEDGLNNNSNSTSLSSINDSRTIIRPLIQPPKTNIDFSSPKSFSQDVFKSKCKRRPKNNNHINNNNDYSQTENTIQQEYQIPNDKPVSPPSSPMCLSFKTSVPINALGDNPFSESLSRIVANKITKVPQPMPMHDGFPSFFQNQHTIGNGYGINNHLNYISLNGNLN